MSGSINKAIIVGNLTAAPEVRNLPNGKKACNLRVATSRSWKDSTGTRQEKSEFHRVTVYNDAVARFADEYCRKGSKVAIEGELETREYTDREGIKRYITEIVISAFRGELTLLAQPAVRPGQDDTSAEGPTEAAPPITNDHENMY